MGGALAPVASGPEGTTTESKEFKHASETAHTMETTHTMDTAHTMETRQTAEKQTEGRTDMRDVAVEQVGFRDQSNCCLTLDVCSFSNLKSCWLHSFSFFFFLVVAVN